MAIKNKRVLGLLFEAYRRNDMARHDSWERQKPLTTRWLGLGTESAYRPLLTAGLMRWHNDRPPPKRCMGWLCLTKQGAKALYKHRHDFKQALTTMKAQADYSRSYYSQYMLMGGIATR